MAAPGAGGPEEEGIPRALAAPQVARVPGGGGLWATGSAALGVPGAVPAAAPTWPPRRPWDPSLRLCGGPGTGGPRSGGAHLAQQPSSGARCLGSVVSQA